jgi:DNA-binding GntR family transcriptional regulator
MALGSITDAIASPAKKSLTDRAFHLIREMIIGYQLKPGVPLRLGDLAGMLAMSQTPVREALSKLETERLVQRQGQRGYVVRPLDAEEVGDLFDFRLILEVAAARRAARSMKENQLLELAGVIDQSAEMLRQGNRKCLLNLERHFHVLILQASGNGIMDRTGAEILERIWMIQNFHLLTSDRRNEAHRQHAGIFEAIRSGHGDEAGRLMEEHLTLARDYILTRLRDRDDILSTLVAEPLRVGS